MTTAENVRDQLLSLKGSFLIYIFLNIKGFSVMRMSRPSFNDPVCMGIDPSDAFATGIEKAMIGINGCDSMEFPVGHYLMAPQTIE